MEEGSPISGVIWLLVLILAQALVTGLKMAFYDVNESSIKKKAEAGDRRAAALLKLLEHPDKYFHVLQLLLNFIGILMGIIYATYFMTSFEERLRNSSNLDMELLKPGYYILFTLLLVMVTTLFGTVLPEKIAAKHAESLSCHTLWLVKLFGFFLRPFAWILEKTMGALLFVFGVKPSELFDNVTEEAIISMVNEGQEQGVFDAGEAEMISNIIELDEKEAQDIMTHKKKIVAVNSDMSLEEALRFMLSENYSRYPLYEGNRDNIIGILHLKDVIGAYISEEMKDATLKEITREPYFVPDTQNIKILFHDMQSKNVHMAIVIDEYGQTAGLVALEDFLEEIVGNIQDEYDEEERMVLSAEEGIYIVKGAIGLDELEDELDIALNQEDFDTLNGLLISILDRIPMDGEKETLEFDGYRFEILEAKNKMIEQVRITRLSEEEADTSEEDAE